MAVVKEINEHYFLSVWSRFFPKSQESSTDANNHCQGDL